MKSSDGRLGMQLGQDIPCYYFLQHVVGLEGVETALYTPSTVDNADKTVNMHACTCCGPGCCLS